MTCPLKKPFTGLEPGKRLQLHILYFVAYLYPTWSSADNSLGADDLYKRSETVHPKAFLKKTGKLAGGGGSGLLHDDIERLMRIILTQGETIHSQLRRLREREGQIETFEQVWPLTQFSSICFFYVKNHLMAPRH